MTRSETIRPFAAGDLEEMLALRMRCFEGLDPAREHALHRWTFADNPIGIEDSPEIWIAEAEGRIVGSVGLLAMRTHFDGEVIPSICGMDICVDRSMRGSGLGHRLTDAWLSTPNARMHVGASPTPVLTALLQQKGASVFHAGREGALFAKGAPFPAPSAPAGIEVRRLDAFGPEFDVLSARIATHHRIVTVRSAAYLTWRYLRDPCTRHTALGAFAADGTLRGHVVLTESERRPQGYVAELSLEPDDADAAQALLGALASTAQARGLEALFALERRPVVRSLFAAAGYVTVSEGAPAPCVLIHGASIDPADWLLSPGDGDFLFRIGFAG